MRFLGDRYPSLHGSNVWRIVVIAGLLLLLVLRPFPGNESLYLALCAVLFVILTVLRDRGAMSSHGQIRSWLIPCFLVLGLFESVNFLHVRGYGILGWGTWVILVLYYVFIPEKERLAFWRRVKPLGGVVAFFMFAVLIALIISPDFRFSLSQWKQFAVLFNCTPYFLLAALYCRSLTEVRRLGWVSALVGGLQAPVVFVESNNIRSIVDRLIAIGLIINDPVITGTRIMGTLDWELTAEYAALMVLLSYTLFCVSRGVVSRLVALLLLVIAIYVGIMTGTRGFIVGLAFLPVLAILNNMAERGVGRKILSMLASSAGLAFVGIVAWQIVPQTAFDQITQRLSKSGTSLTTIWMNSRGYFQADWLQIALRTPLNGQGLLQGLYIVGGTFPGFMPHSLYLWTWVAMGLMGLAALTALLGMLIARAVQSYRIASSWPEMRKWAGFLLVFMLYWVVDEFKIEAVRQMGYMYFFFTWFGVISSVYAISREFAAKREPTP